MFNNFFFWRACPLWDNVEKYGRAGQATDDNKIRRMRIACWITKTTVTYSEYVILIAFPLQQWLRESTSTLRAPYTLKGPIHSKLNCAVLLCKKKLHEKLNWMFSGKAQFSRQVCQFFFCQFCVSCCACDYDG